MIQSKLNRFIIVCIALLVLTGCDVSKRYKRVRDKALNKGIVIPKDTIEVRTSDTIVTTFTRNDTVFTVLKVTDTITLEPIVEIKTKWQTKYETKYKYKTIKVENKAMIDSLKQVVRQERQKTKQTKAKNRRSNWWLWLLIGLVVGYLLNIFLNLRGISKNLKRNYE